jgi:hypothetical protein
MMDKKLQAYLLRLHTTDNSEQVMTLNMGHLLSYKYTKRRHTATILQNEFWKAIIEHHILLVC